MEEDNVFSLTKPARQTLRVVKIAMADFQKHLSVDVPKPDLFSIRDERWDSREQSRHDDEVRWQTGCGVYFYLSEKDDKPLYVGKAVSWNGCPMQRAVADHGIKGLKEIQRWTFAWLFAYEFAFLATSLEVYLISRLSPTFNKQDRLLPTPEGPAKFQEELIQLIARTTFDEVLKKHSEFDNTGASQCEVVNPEYIATVGDAQIFSGDVRQHRSLGDSKTWHVIAVRQGLELDDTWCKTERERTEKLNEWLTSNSRE